MVTLVPCPSCRRHHADTELSCPFCRRAVDRRVVAAVAMLGATLAGCPRPEVSPDPVPVEVETAPSGEDPAQTAPEPAKIAVPEPPTQIDEPEPTQIAEPEPTQTAPDPNRQAPAYGGPPQPTVVPTATPRAPAEAYGAPPPPSITEPR